MDDLDVHAREEIEQEQIDLTENVGYHFYINVSLYLLLNLN